jgi:hypothetical protein
VASGASLRLFQSNQASKDEVDWRKKGKDVSSAQF